MSPYKWIALASLVTVVACLQPPAKQYSTAEIGQLESLQELMRVQAATADPLFGKTEFSDADWASAGEASETLQATAARVAEHFAGQGEYDEGFADFSKQVGAQAAALGAAAEAKDAAAASQALTTMKNACKGCHGVYR